MAKIMFRSGPYAGKALTLPSGKTLVMGRNRDVDLPLPDPKLSRRHCQITFTGQRVCLKDLGSTNGTYVNGVRIAEQDLKSFDRIVLGDVEIELLDFESIAGLRAITEASKTPVAEMAVPRPANAGAQQPLAMDSIDINLDNAPVVEINPNRSGSGYLLPQAGQDSPGKADPFESAVAELSLPLPPEPPAAAATAPAAPKVVFCDGCDSSIPEMDADLGLARQLGGKLYCKQCLPQFEAAAAKAAAQTARVLPGRVQAIPQATDSDIDAMLEGLNQEAVVIDTTLTRRRSAPAPTAGVPSAAVPPPKRQDPPAPARRPPSASHNQTPHKSADQGEELEEIL